MLDAAYTGEVFASPVPDQVLAAARAVDGGRGVLFLVRNYTGDVLNLQLAAEEGIAVATVLIDDDVAVRDSLYTAGRRSTDATMFVERIAGALAETGADVESVEADRDRLTRLDRQIGDGDHGANLVRGFTAVLDAIDAIDAIDQKVPDTPGAVLALTGRTLISTVGGAGGPLYGTVFRRAGRSLGTSADVDLPALADALGAALAGVRALGAAVDGDKTTVDAPAPAVAALSTAAAAGATARAALAAMAQAALPP
jgi:dihydroxyacetone kinase